MKPHKYERKYVPTIKINHSYAVLYQTKLETGDYPSYRTYNFYDQGEKITTYKGEMSKGSQRRLKNACELMFKITKQKYYNHPNTGKRLRFKIALHTLTLSSKQKQTTDRDLKGNYLAPYLRKLKKWGLKNYIWKAERQRNGNLHFHIFVDCFVPVLEARNIWNKIQAKGHFIREFSYKHGHHDPNSTDIKPVVTDEGLIKYMFKYMMKNTEKEDQLELVNGKAEREKGKVWDCAKALKEKNNTADFAEDHEIQFMYDLILSEDVKLVELDFVQIFIFITPNVQKILPDKMRDRYYNYLRHCYTLSQAS